MVHRTQTTKRIWTNEVVYRTSPLGNLGRNIWIGDMSVPLQEGFDSDNQTGFPVGIDNLTTFTFEQGVVGTVSVSQSTAVATPFGSMPTIYNVQLDVVIKASLLKNLPELIKRNPHNNFVKPSAFGFESLKLLDGNISIEPNSKFDNLSDHLTKIGLDKIPFIIFNPFKFPNSIQGLKLCPSFHYLLSLNPDLLSKISLIEDFSFWRDYTDSKMLGIDINSKNILSFWNILFLRKISNNLQLFGQTKGFTNPTIFNQTLESLIIPILPDWNGNPVSRIHPQINEEVGFGIEGLAVSRNVELDGQSIDFVGFLSPSITNDRTDDLNIERGVLFAN